MIESLQKDIENQIKHDEEEKKKEEAAYVPPPTITLEEIMYNLKSIVDE